jgi:hypothetical protein
LVLERTHGIPLEQGFDEWGRSGRRSIYEIPTGKQADFLRGMILLPDESRPMNTRRTLRGEREDEFGRSKKRAASERLRRSGQVRVLNHRNSS